jgi:membrane protein implicated in regulation of membrane protease activity
MTQFQKHLFIAAALTTFFVGCLAVAAAFWLRATFVQITFLMLFVVISLIAVVKSLRYRQMPPIKSDQPNQKNKK